MEEAAKRNFHTLMDGLKQQREINSDQDKKIKELEGKLAALNQSFNALQQQFNSLLVRSTGMGPTSR